MKQFQKNSPSFLPSSDDDVIHVALSVYDPNGTYSRHAGVVIASVLRNTKTPVCFHILHDAALTEENRQKLEKTYIDNVNHMSGHEEQARPCIHFINMSDYEEKYDAEEWKKICGDFTPGTMYRLCMPEALDGISEVIYLDCDVVVNLDVAQMRMRNLKKDMRAEGYSLAGVREYTWLEAPDSDMPRSMIKTDRNGLSNERYINAGVLIMNLEKIRSGYAAKGSLAERAAAYLKAHNVPYPDQDFLNAEFIDDTIYIDNKYNDVPIEDYEDVFNVERIWHFFAKGKPWNVVRGSNADMLYWKNLEHTPWRNELVESFYKAAVNEEFYHRHSRQCVRRLIAQMKNNIRNIRRIFKK